MTTSYEMPVNTVQDILDAIDGHPELQDELWRRLSAPKMANLPYIAEQLLSGQNRLEQRQDRMELAMAELAGRQTKTEQAITKLAERQEETEQALAKLAERQEETERALAKLAERQEETERALAKLAERQEKTEQTLAELTEIVKEMGQRQDRLELAMTALAERQEQTEQALAELTEAVKGIHQRQDHMDGNLRRLTGTAYQRRCASRGRRRIARMLGMSKSRILHLEDDMERDTNLERIIEQAELEGRITEEQAEDLEEIDLVIEDPETGKLAAAEISLNPDAADADRAVRRSNLIALASGQPTQAIVIAPGFDPELRDYAEGLGAKIIAVPDRQ